MSQLVRTDGAGNILFFAVDGYVYDGEGYLIADGLAPGCQECLHPGEMEMHAVPVPGSCSLFYLITSNAGSATVSSRLQVSLLDLTATNSYWPERKGRVLALAEGEASDLYPQLSGWEVIAAGNAQGSLVPAWISGSGQGKSLAPMVRVIQPAGVTDHYLLYLILTDRVKPYKITSGGIFPVPTASSIGIPTFEVDEDPFTYKSLSRDADVDMGPNGEVILAMTDEAMWVRTTATPTGPYQLMTMRFEPISGALQEVTGHAFNGSNPDLPDFFLANSPIPPPTQTITGAKGCALIAGGNKVLMTGTRETATAWEPTIGIYDLNTSAWTDLITPYQIAQPVQLAHNRLYRNRFPGTSEPSVFIPRSNGLAAFIGTNDPGTMDFQANVSTDPAHPVPVFDPTVFPVAQVEAFPYFLNTQITNDNFATQYAATTEGECCIVREQYGATPGYTHAGTATWTASNNPLNDQADVTFTQDVVIPIGTKLYVSGMTRRFAENARLIVKRGGYIKFTNSTLTSLSCSGTRWPGAEVQGTWSQDQNGPTPLNHPTHQGMMELVNSTVENAAIGVLVGARGANGVINPASGGGILTTSNSTIKNCTQGVDMRRYPFSFAITAPVGAANRSRFSKTTFSVDALWPGAFNFKEHVRLDNVNGIRFQQCTFQNLRNTEAGSLALGYGIHSFQSEYKVLSTCTIPLSFGQTCPAANSLPSRFIGLDHGIHAMGGASALRNFTVDRAEFTNNICGVYASGVINFIAKRSTFILGDRNVQLTGDIDESFNFRHRGIFSTECYGFIVEDNTLQQAGTNLTEGIVIGYSREHNDMVFRNNASNLERAYIGEGQCVDLDQRAVKGLHFQCNANADNGTNFWSRIVSGSPASDQTIRTQQGSPSRVADNTFDQDPGRIDFSNDGCENNIINYWWALPEAPYKPVYTSCVSEDNDLNGVLLVRTSATCASRLRPRNGLAPQVAELPLVIAEEKLAYANSAYLYKQLIDGGNTDEVLDEVVSAWPSEAWTLLAHLLNASPYLTVEVLKEVVAKPGFPAAMKAQVCIANPDATKTEGFMQWMREDAPELLPESLLASIEASWETQTLRTQLEGTMAYHHDELSQATGLLLEHLSSDTLTEPLDSLRGVWRQLRSPGARYAEAVGLIQQGDLASARDLVEGIQEEHELRLKEESEQYRMLAVIDLLEAVANDARTETELTLHEQDELEDIIAGQYDRSATWAQNLLCFYYGRCRSPLTGGDSQPKSRGSRSVPVAEREDPLLTVAPNPATTWATFTYMLAAEANGANIMVHDTQGRNVAQFPLENVEGQLVWDTRSIAPGAYSIELFLNGKRLQTERLVVNP